MNLFLAPHARALFEELAAGTWERLMYSVLLSCSQGETTITDLNLLELIRAHLPGLRIYKAHSRDESRYGFDWEWFVGRPGSWFRYSVQAKKLDIHSQRYKSLRHKVGPTFQLEILKNFAKTQKTIPLYCFYNYVSSNADAKAGWNCKLSFDATQLGCTIAPLHVVESQHQARVAKDFAAVHTGKGVFPWRCLICCPTLQPEAPDNPLLPTSHTPKRLEALPSYLANLPEMKEDSPFADNICLTVELPDEEYASELEGFPERIMIIDLGKM